MIFFVRRVEARVTRESSFLSSSDFGAKPFSRRYLS
jgi:hypothetical protein